MKKLSLLAAAAVIGWAGQAFAQTSDSVTLTATANIDATVTLTVRDSTPSKNCGTVQGHGTPTATCPNNPTWLLNLVSNADWNLTILDNDNTTGNQVTLSNDDGTTYTGDFAIGLSSTLTSGPATGSQDIDISTTTISNLGPSDEFGTYSGDFTVTVTQS